MPSSLTRENNEEASVAVVLLDSETLPLEPSCAGLELFIPSTAEKALPFLTIVEELVVVLEREVPLVCDDPDDVDRTKLGGEGHVVEPNIVEKIVS